VFQPWEKKQPIKGDQDPDPTLFLFVPFVICKVHLYSGVYVTVFLWRISLNRDDDDDDGYKVFLTLPG